MATKTRRVKTPKGSQESQVIIEKAKSTAAALERNLTIYDSDLKRAENELVARFGVSTIEEAMEKVQEMNARLPALQAERDEHVVKIQEYLEGAS